MRLDAAIQAVAEKKDGRMPRKTGHAVTKGCEVRRSLEE
jgi:hypothetical protein